MMPHSSYRWYILFSRSLLGYLLGLYLIGFSWHLLSHERSNSPYHASASEASHQVLYTHAACLLCDWLVDQSGSLLAPPSDELFLRATGSLYVSVSPDTVICETYLPRDSRAPPQG